MKRIRIDELDIDNTYFHFTREKWIEDIEKNGVTAEPPERENMVARDKENPCIYFSAGSDGLLKTIDVWIRWEYNNIASEMRLPSGHRGINEEVLQKTYEKVYEDFKKRKYLKLDLIEGDNPKTSDFSFLAPDYKKEMALKRGEFPAVFRWLYGEYSNFESAIMEDWNMNTHIGKKTIEPNRIMMLTDNKGRTDALSVIQEVYQRQKSKLNLKSLDGFMNYVIEQSRDNNEHEYYYHHTRVEDLESILRKGLEIRNGIQSQAVKDQKTKVFFSEGMEGAIAMTSAFQHKFDYMKTGTEWDDRTLEDFLGERVFLRFLPEGIENESDKGDFAFADGWTSQGIQPQRLKVCILKNIKTGEISYQRDDVLKYMLATNPIENFKNGNERHKAEIKRYYEERSEELTELDIADYSLEDMDLDKFYEQYIDKRKESIIQESTLSREALFSPREIGKATINTPTEEKDKAQSRQFRDEKIYDQYK